MGRGELLAELRRLAEASDDDPETAHANADEALLAYLADDEITEAFTAVERWYS